MVTDPRLALLIAAPQPGETAMLRDQAAMAAALRERGLAADHILALQGELDRSRVTAFLQAAGRRVAGWREGSVFLHVSGHGFFAGDTVETARPGLLFSESDDVADDGHLFWDDLFAALALPPGVRLTLLPDLWHANLLAGRVPAHVSGIIPQAAPGMELACRAHNLPAEHPAAPRGVLSYYAALALPAARTLAGWLDNFSTLIRQDVDAGRLPRFYQPDLHLLGDGSQPVPGTTGLL